MSIVDYIRKQEYIVTVKDFADLDVIYDELESVGKTPPTADLERSVHCVHRKPLSRNTHYLLAEWEALELAKDPRILSVELAPHLKGINPGLLYEEEDITVSEEQFENSIDETTASIQQTSSGWDKSGSTSNTMRNWALLRCIEGVQRSGWGGTGYEGGGTGTASQTGTITLSQIGRNVDVVICDENGIVWNHPEYAVNADGTGGSRAVQYNWFQHDLAVKGTSPGTYSYGTGGHSTHVAGTVAGNTQGWARAANIYNIYYAAGDESNDTFPYVMDYVREFHRTKSVNPATGRKNPTIVNNSWGMSIFPSEWSFSDITAVTYRGIRYTPETGATTYTGYSGVCTSNQRLATLLGEENFGNRISTAGPYTPPSGFIVNKPASWSQTGQQAYLTQLSEPAGTYTITVDGPADLDLIHNVAVDAISGVISLEGEIIIYDGSSTEITRFSAGPVSETNGGTIEIDIRETYSLTNNEVYTVIFNTISQADDPVAQFATAMSLTVKTESSPASASVTSITNSLLGPASLTASTTPTDIAGNTTNPNDDAFWTLNLPFSIEYLGNSYSTIYVSTNHYLTFGGGSFNYTGLGPANPNLPKIMWSCADNSIQRIYYGTEGSAPNRTYRVRTEGNASTSGTLGSPGMVCEWVFYENNPTQIDLQLGVNNRKTTGSGFTTNQLNAWGFIAGQRIPARVTALDTDLEDAYAEGIIQVGAAGNGRWKHDLPGGLDWDNTFEMGTRYPGQVYYYMRGTSPTANDTAADGTFELPAICVGSVDTRSTDQKVVYSDCGPGVDIWAPGTYIISSYTGGVSDSRGTGLVGKLSGTSMASPQVCGVIACALEKYPHWNQYQAKQYIQAIAKSNQLTESNGGPADGQDLQNAPNLFLYYKIERQTTGLAFPSLTNSLRPETGAVYPRTRIRRTY